MFATLLLVAWLVLAGSPVGASTLESPAHKATLSGLGFISGWKCNAGNITVTINDGGHIPVATGQPRADTRIACGTIHNGFITQMNWALLGDGKHSIVAYDDGVKFASAVFTVVTAGEPYLPDAAGECVVPDFPAPGENASFAWNTSTQHLELTDVGSHVVPPEPGTAALERFVGLWQAEWHYTSEGCTHHPSFTTTYPFFLSAAGELDTSNGLWIVLPTGHMEGSFPLEPDGERALSVSGVYKTETAAGTWFTIAGCGGTWTAQKISEDPFAEPPKPEPEPIHGQCGSTRNTCRVGTPNDSAVADTDTHYRWVCTGQHGGMNSGTCQAAKPPPPPDENAALRKILGTWVFRYGATDTPIGDTVLGEHQWTLTRVTVNKAANHVAYGTLSNGIPVTAYVLPPNRYAVRWQWNGKCAFHAFSLTSSTTAQGTYTLYLEKLDGSCGTTVGTLDTFGRRIRAPQ